VASVRTLVLVLFGLAFALVGHAQESASFVRAETPRVWSFPRDHGAHPGYATEWWYFTGSVYDTEGFHYGYELTFFRVGLRPDAVASTSAWRASDLVLAHFAVTEVTWERFHVHERIQRAAAGMAGADTTHLHVWVGDWAAEQLDDGRIRVRAREGATGIDLELTSTRPPVLHGENGLSWKTDDRMQASHYYSLTRLQTTGTIVVGDHPRRVSGMTWMDQEFFTGDTPREGLGWDWFSARLADGRDLMFFRLRREGMPDSYAGTLVTPDGSARPLDTTGMQVRPGRTWSSPRTNAIYPIEWRVELPAERAELEVRALLPQQEVVAEQTVGFAYWEGISQYTGTWDGTAIEGEGYVELTGYAPTPGSTR
jgi:predicted secreted hydrolase